MSMPIRLGMRVSTRLWAYGSCLVDPRCKPVLQAREIDCDEQNAAEHHLANRWFDADQVHDVFNDGNDDDRAKDAGETANAAAEAGAAEDRAGEDHEDRSFAQVGDNGLKTSDFEEAANGGGKAGNGETQYLGALDLDAGEESGFLVVADGVDLLADAVPLHDHPGDEVEQQPHEDRDRNAEPALLAEIGVFWRQVIDAFRDQI